MNLVRFISWEPPNINTSSAAASIELYWAREAADGECNCPLSSLLLSSQQFLLSLLFIVLLGRNSSFLSFFYRRALVMGIVFWAAGPFRPIEGRQLSVPSTLRRSRWSGFPFFLGVIVLDTTAGRAELDPNLSISPLIAVSEGSSRQTLVWLS